MAVAYFAEHTNASVSTTYETIPRSTTTVNEYGGTATWDDDGSDYIKIPENGYYLVAATALVSNEAMLIRFLVNNDVVFGEQAQEGPGILTEHWCAGRCCAETLQG
jgi:hypothetical protein